MLSDQSAEQGRFSRWLPRPVTLAILAGDVAIVCLLVAWIGHPAEVVGTYVVVCLGAALFKRRLPGS